MVLWLEFRGWAADPGGVGNTLRVQLFNSAEDMPDASFEERARMREIHPGQRRGGGDLFFAFAAGRGVNHAERHHAISGTVHLGRRGVGVSD